MNRSTYAKTGTDAAAGLTARGMSCERIGYLLLIMSLAANSALHGAAQSKPDDTVILQGHYDAAQEAQSNGKLDEAARQYRLFVADTLAKLAVQRAQVDQYRLAIPIFEEALRLAPNSPGLRVEYLRAAYANRDLDRAWAIANQVLNDYPGNAGAAAKAHLMLGRVALLRGRGEYARRQFEDAIARSADFEDGYALAVACLTLEDKVCATKVFNEMIAGLGDTGDLHMQIGRAYLNSDFQNQAASEFQAALAIDPNFPGAHYALAVTYLTVDNNLASAESELRLELKQAPNDAKSHAFLGNIDCQRQQYTESEHELIVATTLDDQNPDAWLYLGRLYHQTGRKNDAIEALRKSIARTKDPSYNRYQVREAHYLLARLLSETGDKTQGKEEFQIAGALLNQSLNKDRVELAGHLGAADSMQIAESAPAVVVSKEQADQPSTIQAGLDAFQKRFSPAVADSYNNLGAIAAVSGEYGNATDYFQQAFAWNPKLSGLDLNWGRAAFYAGRYTDAIAPLTSYENAHSGDKEIRSALAICFFMTGDYPGTLAALTSMPDQVRAKPQLSYIYAVALVKTGNLNDGISRLLALESDDERNSDIHTALGEAYAGQNNFVAAARELEMSIALNPRDAIAYCMIGTIETMQKDFKKAIASLESAVKLDPTRPEYHRQLALAYREALRNEDAGREQAAYEALNKKGSIGDN
jgi:tetratricopeptide (TPR) repeat protein